MPHSSANDGRWQQSSRGATAGCSRGLRVARYG